MAASNPPAEPPIPAMGQAARCFGFRSGVFLADDVAFFAADFLAGMASSMNRTRPRNKEGHVFAFQPLDRGGAIPLGGDFLPHDQTQYHCHWPIGGRRGPTGGLSAK